MSWIIYVVLYLFFAVTFNQCYKIVTKKMKKAGALTIILELLAGLIAFVFIPFFEIKFPSNISVYLFLGLAIVFYTINDRLGTTVRSGLEASTYNIIGQLSTVFMIFAGLFFFKEEFVVSKIIGAFLIVFSNILVFYKRGTFKIDKYIGLGIIANLCLSIALFIDVNNSEMFNIPFYVGTTLIIPTILIFIFERIKIKDIKEELNSIDKKMVLITSFSWAIMLILQLRAYQVGDVTIIAPLLGLTVILNVVVGYLFLGEKDNLVKKLIAAILVIISIFLIKG